MYVYQLKTREQLTEYQTKKLLKYVPEWGNIQESIRNPQENDLYILAFKKRAVVGVSVVSDYEDHYSEDPADLRHELNIYVLPDYRNQGVGRGMVEKIFRATKIKKLRIHLTENGQPFFSSFGKSEYSTILTKTSVFWDSQTFVNPITFRNISIRTAKRLPVTHPARSIAEYLTNQHFKMLTKQQKERTDE